MRQLLAGPAGADAGEGPPRLAAEPEFATSATVSRAPRNRSGTSWPPCAERCRASVFWDVSPVRRRPSSSPAVPIFRPRRYRRAGSRTSARPLMEAGEWVRTGRQPCPGDGASPSDSCRNACPAELLRGVTIAPSSLIRGAPLVAVRLRRWRGPPAGGSAANHRDWRRAAPDRADANGAPLPVLGGPGRQAHGLPQ